MWHASGMAQRIVGAVLFLLGVSAPSFAQEIHISRASFCTGIKDREPLDPVADRVRLKADGWLFYWTEIQGGPEALQSLEAKGQLLVKHQWREGILVTDVIEVGITIDKWLENREALRQEVRERGFFTYRTFSYKAMWESGTYTLITLNSQNKAVTQLGGTRAFRPEITIEAEEE